MRLPIFQVDAFTDKVFGGNPAAICPLENWLSDDVMQRIAMENSVAETAFFIPSDEGFAIRWFTPEIEMDLCGHATLAAAHVIARHLNYSLSTVEFQSKSGKLTVVVEDNLLTLNFPSRTPQPSKVPQIILDAIAYRPTEILKSRDYILVFEDEAIIRLLQPNQNILNQINLDPGGIAMTAPGKEVDFVSRFFTPQASIFEDPVTGSAYCSLIPYWSEKLNKDSMVALQLSSRVGARNWKILHTTGMFYLMFVFIISFYPRISGNPSLNQTYSLDYALLELTLLIAVFLRIVVFIRKMACLISSDQTSV